MSTSKPLPMQNKRTNKNSQTYVTVMTGICNHRFQAAQDFMFLRLHGNIIILIVMTITISKKLTDFVLKKWWLKKWDRIKYITTNRIIHQFRHSIFRSIHWYHQNQRCDWCHKSILWEQHNKYKLNILLFIYTTN